MVVDGSGGEPDPGLDTGSRFEQGAGWARASSRGNTLLKRAPIWLEVTDEPDRDPALVETDLERKSLDPAG